MISEAELAQMKADLWERLRHKEKKIVALEREVEELRAALRDARNEALEEAARLHEQLYVAHDDAMTAIVKYRDAIRAIKARAALWEKP